MRRYLIASSAALFVLLAGQVAGAAGSVTITAASRTGDTLAVSGSAVFADQPFVQMGTDPANDATTPAPVGQDLTAAAMRMRADGQLEFQWTVSLIPPAAGGAPALFYGWTFCVTEETCYELDAGRFYGSPTQAAFTGALWACSDSSCGIAGQSSSGVPVAVTVAGPVTGPNTITARVSASAIGAVPGTPITPVVLSPFGPAFTGIYDSYATGNVLLDVGDGVNFETPFDYTGRRVSLAVAAPGQDPSAVTYSTHVVAGPSGAYNGSLDVAGLTGAKTVYAKACLGANNCATTTSDITL